MPRTNFTPKHAPNERNLEEAKRLLHIIIAAERPLTLKEMSVAFAVRANHRSYSDLGLRSEEHFREYIRDLCSLFVTIIDLNISAIGNHDIRIDVMEMRNRLLAWVVLTKCLGSGGWLDHSRF